MTIFDMLTPEVLGGNLLAGFGFFYMINKLLQIIGAWKMFTKSGEAGWKSLIPVYSTYTRYDMYWDKKFFWAYLMLSFVSFFLGVNATGFLAVVAALVSLALIVVVVKLAMKTARSFGKGTGMGILLILMPWLATIILGFGKAEYQGKVMN